MRSVWHQRAERYLELSYDQAELRYEIGAMDWKTWHFYKRTWIANNAGRKTQKSMKARRTNAYGKVAK